MVDKKLKILIFKQQKKQENLWQKIINTFIVRIISNLKTILLLFISVPSALLSALNDDLPDDLLLDNNSGVSSSSASNVMQVKTPSSCLSF